MIRNNNLISNRDFDYEIEQNILVNSTFQNSWKINSGIIENRYITYSAFRERESKALLFIIYN